MDESQWRERERDIVRDMVLERERERDGLLWGERERGRLLTLVRGEGRVVMGRGRERERERERGEEMVYGYKFQMKYMRLTCSNYYLRLIKLYYIPEYYILVILYHLKTKIVQKKKKALV
jgi:hypothetical protein